MSAELACNTVEIVVRTLVAVKLTGKETVLLADGGTLGSDGICRLKAWGYVVCDVAP